MVIGRNHLDGSLKLCCGPYERDSGSTNGWSSGKGEKANALADAAARYTTLKGASLFCDEFSLGSLPHCSLDGLLERPAAVCWVVSAPCGPPFVCFCFLRFFCSFLCFVF